MRVHNRLHPMANASMRLRFIWASIFAFRFVVASVPDVSVPLCNEGYGQASPYYITDAPGFSNPVEQTLTLLCWNVSGIVVYTNNTDSDIWQTCDSCGCANFAHGDVAEVFIAPVSSPDRSPSWYYELDVGAVAGSFWGGVVHNTLGDENLYSSSLPCALHPAPGAFESCPLNCSGVLPSVIVQEGLGWWSRTMLIPWELFQEGYAPAGGGSKPWRHWRANFYRYSYPFKLPDGGPDHQKPELSGWSATHSPTFHVPTQFGKLTFLDGPPALVGLPQRPKAV